MRVYISGPISGLPDGNRTAFAAAASALRAAGHDPVSPHDLHHAQPDQSYAACMRRDLVALLSCDAVALLDGHGRSPGCRVEVAVARAVGAHVAPVAAFCLPQDSDAVGSSP